MGSAGSSDVPADGSAAWSTTPQPWPQPDLGTSQRGQVSGAFGQSGPYPDTFGEPGQYPGFQPQPSGSASGRTNPLAVAALVCGIGQFLLGLLIVGNILLAIPAVALGVIGIRQIRSRGERGRGMAIAGIVLGVLGIFYFALVLIIVMLVGLSPNT